MNSAGKSQGTKTRVMMSTAQEDGTHVDSSLDVSGLSPALGTNPIGTNQVSQNASTEMINIKVRSKKNSIAQYETMKNKEASNMGINGIS